MSHKKTVGTLLGLSILVFIVGFVLIQPEIFNMCRSKYLYQFGEEGNINNPLEIGCMDPLGDNIGQPLFMGSFVLGVVFLPLFFLPPVYFRAWLKYAAWFIPVSFIWISTSDVNCGGFLPVCFDKELATWWSGGIYLVLSLLVITVTFLGHRRGTAR